MRGIMITESAVLKIPVIFYYSELSKAVLEITKYSVPFCSLVTKLWN